MTDAEWQRVSRETRDFALGLWKELGGTPMSDIEKLLTEAGFMWEDQLKVWEKTLANGIISALWRRNDGTWTATLFFHEAVLGPLLLALQGKVGLTVEERKHLTETLADMTNEATAMQLEGRLHSSEQVNGWANTLNNLLTRSASDTVSLTDVGIAIRTVLHGVRMSVGSGERRDCLSPEQVAAKVEHHLKMQRLTCSGDVIPPLTTEEMLHQVNEALHVFRRKGREGKLVWDSDDCALWEDVAETIVKRLIHFSDGCVSLTDVEEVVLDNVRAWCDGNQTIHRENVGDFVNDILADLTSKRKVKTK